MKTQTSRSSLTSSRPRNPPGISLAFVVTRLSEDPDARLEEIAEDLGMTRQAVYKLLRDNGRMDLLADRSRLG